jgi:hypothetical protein
MPTLAEIVHAAVVRMAQPGITGWDLNNPNEELFDTVKVSEDKTKLILVDDENMMINLGYETYNNSDLTLTYYAVVSVDGTAEFFRLREERQGRCDCILGIDAPDVPEYMLAKLAEQPNEETR